MQRENVSDFQVAPDTEATPYVREEGDMRQVFSELSFLFPKLRHSFPGSQQGKPRMVTISL